MHALETGDCEAAQNFLNEQLLDTISYFDYAESYYHGFMAGLGFTLWPQRLRGGCHMPGPGAPARCRDMAFASLDRNDL